MTTHTDHSPDVPAHGRDHEPKDLTVTIVNEDDGTDFPLHAGPGTPVQTVIDRMYEKLGRSRQDDDRLRCEGSGVNVYDYAGMHVGEFSTAQCSDLVWLFAGGTGGAAC